MAEGRKHSGSVKKVVEAAVIETAGLELENGPGKDLLAAFNKEFDTPGSPLHSAVELWIELPDNSDGRSSVAAIMGNNIRKAAKEVKGAANITADVIAAAISNMNKSVPADIGKFKATLSASPKNSPAGDAAQALYDAALAAAWQAVKLLNCYPDTAGVDGKTVVVGSGEVRFKQHVDSALNGKDTAQAVEALNEYAAALQKSDNKQKIDAAPKTVGALMDKVKGDAARLVQAMNAANLALLEAEYVNGKTGTDLKQQQDAFVKAEEALENAAKNVVSDMPQYSFAHNAATAAFEKERTAQEGAAYHITWTLTRLNKADKDAKLDIPTDGAIKGSKIGEAVIMAIKGGKDMDPGLVPDKALISSLIGGVAKASYVTQEEVDNIAKAYLSALKSDDGKYSKDNVRAAQRAMANSILDNLKFAQTPANIILLAKAYDNAIGKVQGNNNYDLRIKNVTNHKGQTAAVLALGLATFAAAKSDMGNKESVDGEEKGVWSFGKKVMVAIGAVLTLGLLANVLTNNRISDSIMKKGGYASGR